MITKRKQFYLLVAASALAPLLAPGADWTQDRGPNHDGTSPEKILTQWPADGLKQIWKVPLKDGFSTLTLGEGKAFTMVAREADGVSNEVCVALDANTGKEVWAMPLGVAKYASGGSSGTPDNSGGDGPRSTPSYDSGKVYVFSSRMVLKCFNAADGKEQWSADLVAEHGGRIIQWGSAASPLIEGDRIFIAGGGMGQALLSLDKNTGKVLWQVENDRPTQSTPIATTIFGVRQIIYYTQAGLVSVVPATGAVLWRYPFKYSTSAAISPVVAGDTVYVSAAYNVGAGACKITKTNEDWTATEIWRKPGNALGSHWTTPVVSGGYLYGIFGQAQFGKAPLECIDLATGDVKWTQPGYGPGGLTLVDGHILALNDRGDLMLIKPTADAYTEEARTKILDGKCWNLVTISNGRLYARSTKEGVCLNIAPTGMPNP